MESNTWQQYVDRLYAGLRGICFTDSPGQGLNTDAAFAAWTTWTLDLGRAGRSVYLIGNGASASMASHFAADLAKNARLHAQVFSDLSLITAISNDIGYDQVFAEPLRRRGHPGDMLIAISSSGKSPNILAAAQVALDLKMTLITLSAMSPDNPLRSRGRLNLYVGAESYGAAESAHAAALHRWMDLVQAQSISTNP
jgi:D-sedoheptulose 7-phosphate isomerase